MVKIAVSANMVPLFARDLRMRGIHDICTSHLCVDGGAIDIIGLN